MVTQQPPVCLAMLLCDSVVKDGTTGKRTIFGTFSAIGAASFPTIHPQLTLYVELTDGRGEVDISLRLTRVTADDIDGEAVIGASLNVPFADPRAVLQMDLKLANVPFPQPGEYRFILETADGALIAERRLVVLATGDPTVE